MFRRLSSSVAAAGFGIGVAAWSEGSFGRLQISVAGHGEEADYSAKGGVSGDRIDFNLGELGKIEVEVSPHSEMRTVHTGCGNGKAVKAPTVGLVGTIEFHGEEGFSEADVGDVVASAVPFGDMVCSMSSSEIAGEGLPGTRLEVKRTGGPTLLIEQKHPGGRAYYLASLFERLGGGLDVTREVWGSVPAADFRFDQKLSKATFDPGGHLAGSATYRATSLPHGGRSGRGKLSGNLTADFPGHAEVPLAGSGFSASMIHVAAGS